MDRDNVYRLQILDAIADIERHILGFDYELFQHDVKTQDAVVRKLEIIGEIVKRLSADFKSLYDLPWVEIAGFRDKAIHDYLDITIERVWETATQDVPLLKQRLQTTNHRS